mmetsp:Transcript_9444/g.22761  ORF Transcript_9444/g.22761 Transcript_9444/m.22761 type:complete len:123 (-) Transcript_9444:247-615(-)
MFPCLEMETASLPDHPFAQVGAIGLPDAQHLKLVGVLSAPAIQNYRTGFSRMWRLITLSSLAQLWQRCGQHVKMSYELHASAPHFWVLGGRSGPAVAIFGAGVGRQAGSARSGHTAGTDLPG